MKNDTTKRMTLEELNEALSGKEITCKVRDDYHGNEWQKEPLIIEAVTKHCGVACYVKIRGEERERFKQVWFLEELAKNGEIETYRDNREEREALRFARCYPLPCYISYTYYYKVKKV